MSESDYNYVGLKKELKDLSSLREYIEKGDFHNAFLILSRTLNGLEKMQALADICIQENISFTDSLFWIFDHLCEENDNIISVNIPARVDWVGENAFAKCSNLVKVTFNGSCKIGFQAFFKTAIKELKLPKGSEFDVQAAFKECQFLETLDAFDAERLILKGSSFSNCTSLRIVKLPKHFSLSLLAFVGDKKIEEIHYNGSKEDFKKELIDSAEDGWFKLLADRYKINFTLKLLDGDIDAFTMFYELYGKGVTL